MSLFSTELIQCDNDECGRKYHPDCAKVDINTLPLMWFCSNCCDDTAGSGLKQSKRQLNENTSIINNNSSEAKDDVSSSEEYLSNSNNISNTALFMRKVSTDTQSISTGASCDKSCDECVEDGEVLDEQLHSQELSSEGKQSNSSGCLEVGTNNTSALPFSNQEANDLSSVATVSRFHCKVCDVLCNSSFNLQQHMGGKKHRERLLEAEKVFTRKLVNCTFVAPRKLDGRKNSQSESDGKKSDTRSKLQRERKAKNEHSQNVADEKKVDMVISFLVDDEHFLPQSGQHSKQSKKRKGASLQPNMNPHSSPPMDKLKKKRRRNRNRNGKGNETCPSISTPAIDNELSASRKKRRMVTPSIANGLSAKR